MSLPLRLFSDLVSEGKFVVLFGPRLISPLITRSISGFVARRRSSGACRWRWAGVGGEFQVLPGGSRWGRGSGRWKVAGGVLGATSTLAWQMLRWWGGCATTENSHWGEIWRLFVNVNENVSCDLQILSAVGLGKEGYKGCLPPPAPEGCS